MWTLLLPLLTSADLVFNQKQLYFSQVINHFHVPYKERGQFIQRYWVVDDYWDPVNGPAFLYICGEYECPGVPSNRLYPMIMAQKYKARFYVLEHRYYGESYPMMYNNMMPDLYEHLEAEQALADIAYFINQMNRKMSLTRPNPPKWLVIGGSYPGALSAWTRTRYPDLVTASWSSSGVVRPILNYTDYDAQVYRSTLKSGQACVDSIRAVNQLAEDNYKAGTIDKITDVLGLTGQFPLDQLPVVELVSDLVAGMVQYGHRTELCNAMTNVTDVWDKLRNLRDVSAVYEGGVSAQGTSISSLRNRTYESSKNGRPWTWQFCNQFGWFQVASDYKMRSTLINLDYWKKICNAVFDYPGGLNLPDANLSGHNLNYMGTQIIYLNGGEDPWQWAGVRESKDPERPAILIDCDDCGHCADLYTPLDSDPPQLKAAREQIDYYIGKWIG